MFLDERKFLGINTTSSPSLMQPGELLACQDAYIDAPVGYQTIVGPYGIAGGEIWSRLGRSGLLSDTTGDPLVAPLPFLNSNGTTDLLLGSGPLNLTSSCKLYKYATGGSSLTEVQNGSSSFSLNAKGLRTVRLGSYAYIVDGVNGLIRTDLTSANSGSVQGMNPPPSAPTVSLTNQSVDAMTSTTGWSARPAVASPDVSLEDPTFVNGFASGTSDWICSSVSASPEPTLPTGSPGTGTALYFDGGSTPSSVQQSFNVVAQTGGVTAAARLYKVTLYVNSYNAADSIAVTAVAYTGSVTSVNNVNVPGSGATILGVATGSFQAPYNGGSITADNWHKMSIVLSFDELPTDPGCIQLTLQDATGNHVGGGNTYSIYGYDPVVEAVDAPLAFSAQPAGGFQIAASTTDSGLYTNQNYLVKTFGSATDLSANDVLAFGYRAPTISGQIAFVLGMQISAGTIYWTNPAVYDPVAGSYFSFDTTVIPLATRQQCKYLYLQFQQDMPADSSPNNFATVGPLSSSGNLSSSLLGTSQQVAGTSYLYTEVDGTGDLVYMINILESDGSPNSATLNPTGLNATGVIKLPGKINSVATHARIYRFGGAWTDGYWRCIATVPFDADVGAPYTYSDLAIDASNAAKITSSARPFVSGDVGLQLTITGGTGFTQGVYFVISVSSGAAIVSLTQGGSASAIGTTSSTGGVGSLCFDGIGYDQFNSKFTWSHSDLTLTDNTDDQSIANANVYEIGRNSIAQISSTAPQAIGTYLGRIALGLGSVLALSWSVAPATENGLYFTAVSLPSDPDEGIKGFTYPLNPGDNDPIQAFAMSPIGNGLLIFKQYSVWLMSGTDATSFAIQPVYASSLQAAGATGIGLVAPGALAVVGQEVWFLAADGIWAYTASGTLERRSVKIETQFSSKVIANAATYAGCSMFVHDLGVFVLAPHSSASTGNDVSWRYDMRTGTWSKYTNYAFTGGCSLTSSTDTNNGYACGYSGQLYLLDNGFSDQETPGGTATAISAVATTRGMGREQPGWSSYTDTRMLRYAVALTISDNCSFTITAQELMPDGSTAANAYTKTHTVTGPQTVAVANSLPTSVRGQLLTLTCSVTAPSTSQVRILSMGGDFGEGSVAR